MIQTVHGCEESDTKTGAGGGEPEAILMSAAGRIANGYFHRLAGLDISQEMMRQVPIPDIDFRVAQVENMPFPDDLFNVVTLHSVLHHLFEMEAQFREIYRCLNRRNLLCRRKSECVLLRTLHGVDTSDVALHLSSGQQLNRCRRTSPFT